MPRLDRTESWRVLCALRDEQAGATLRILFQADPGRARRYLAVCDGLELDYSRNRIDDAVLGALLALAREQGLAGCIASLFAGEPVNATENRPALHMALRQPLTGPAWVGGEAVRTEVAEVRKRMGDFCRAAEVGRWRGYGGEPVTDVVQIGIGGSDLGPRMAWQALASGRRAGRGPNLHFVANVDGAELAAVLAGLNPATTGLIVISKSFTTQETHANFSSALAWLTTHAGPGVDLSGQLLAVTAAPEAARAAGFDPGHIFPLWDWVGGRYSLWSAVGLGLALGLGMERFEELLAGGHAMDRHFRDTRPDRNLPVLLALTGIWNCNLLGAASCLVQPYSQGLARMPAYLQQLEMESNGKGVTMDGERVTWATAPVVWGEPGTNAQHAYFQLLHQGTRNVAVDFILPLRARHGLAGHHDLLVANCLAQASALAFGRDENETRALLEAEGHDRVSIERLMPHRRCPGNRASNLIVIRQLDPCHLGMLIALYEHKVFVQSVIWGINAFDQWGVELGKVLAGNVLEALTAGHPPRPSDFDAATWRMIERYRQSRDPATGD